MKYNARSYKFEPAYRITDAVVTDDRVSLDWEEANWTGHLEATSTDGQTYVGTYGYPRLDSDYHVEFTLFRANAGAKLLFGRWWGKDGEGQWLIHLLPESNS